MSKPLLILTNCLQCPHCIRYKADHWDRIKTVIEQSKLVDIRELTTPRLGEVPQIDTRHFPNDIVRYINRYPTFLLFPRNNWNAALQNPNIQLTGAIFNQTMINGVPETTGNLPPDEINLLAWIRNELKNSPFTDNGIQPLIAGKSEKNKNKPKENPKQMKSCMADSPGVCQRFTFRLS